MFMLYQKVEPWENEITWADLSTYVWDKSKAKEQVERLVEKLPHAVSCKLFIYAFSVICAGDILTSNSQGGSFSTKIITTQ